MRTYSTYLREQGPARQRCGDEGGRRRREVPRQRLLSSTVPRPVVGLFGVSHAPRHGLRAGRASPRRAEKRGPKTPVTDADLVTGIRAVLADTPFHCEGRRKVCMRLRARGPRASRDRVLRLMRPHGLPGATTHRHRYGDPARGHDRPNRCGALMRRGSTPSAIAGAVLRRDRSRQRRHGRLASRQDWRPVGRSGTINQGVQAGFGPFATDIARGLAVRSDWGPQYVADAFRNELAWPSIPHSPSFEGAPQSNGVIEWFMRALKEQCPWLHRFDTLQEARTIIGTFIARNNAEWLIERFCHRTPAVGRQQLLPPRDSDRSPAQTIGCDIRRASRLVSPLCVLGRRTILKNALSSCESGTKPDSMTSSIQWKKASLVGPTQPVRRRSDGSH
jgi:putative transposase